jgi:hypothetical protein
VSAYFNFDNGTGRVRGVWMQGNAAARPLLARWLAPVADLGATTLTLANTGAPTTSRSSGWGCRRSRCCRTRSTTSRARTTRTPTWRRTWPADDLKQAAVVTATLLYNAANAAERVPRPPLPAPRTQAAER